MKKISEQTKNFLLYGIDHTIQPKEIYKLDGAILSFSRTEVTGKKFFGYTEYKV